MKRKTHIPRLPLDFWTARPPFSHNTPDPRLLEDTDPASPHIDDGTAEVTQVGEDQKPLPWANFHGNEEGDNYEAIHERDQVFLGDITIPEARFPFL